MFANFILVCAALCSFGYIYYTQFFKSRGGDARIGHAFVTYWFFQAFVIVMAIMTITIGIKGGFSWLDSNSMVRFFIAFAGFLLTIYGLFIFEDPGIGLSRNIRQIGSFLLVLLLLIWGAAHLTNGFWGALPPSATKWLTIAVFAVGMLPIASKLVLKQINFAKKLKERGKPSSFEMGIIARIDSTDVQKGISSLLVHTAEGRHPIIREKAIAKVKSRPDWQEEMVRLLNNGDTDVFYFLSSNAVEKMDIFPAAINKGIVAQSEMIREKIRNCSHRDHLRKNSFFFEINDLLKSLKPFKKAGYDFTPSLQALRNAFNERCKFEKPKFDVIKMIEKAM